MAVRPRGAPRNYEVLGSMDSRISIGFLGSLTLLGFLSGFCIRLLLNSDLDLILIWI